jgi:hypothetical protein
MSSFSAGARLSVRDHVTFGPRGAAHARPRPQPIVVRAGFEPSNSLGETADFGADHRVRET